MTFVDRTARGQSDTITFEFDLPHAPTKVWRALTDPTLLAEWLLPAVGLELEPGATFTFRRPPVGGWDGIVHCRLLEIDAPRRISYTWVVGDLHTVVTFTLAAAADGTRMTLVHSGFTPDQRQNFGGARHGWRMMSDKLVALLARVP